jgi:PAS domain S-box-containing protein
VDLDRVLHGTLFGEALTNAQVAALLADERGQYVAANDRACELTGYDREALTGFRAGQLAADERSRQIYEHISTGKKMRGIKVVRRRDGHDVRCRYWAIPTLVARLPYVILLLWAAETPA